MHMKRLLIPILLLTALVAVATPARAQSKDIAGAWTLDAAKSGTTDGPPMVVLTIKGNDLTARMGSATAREMPFKLDGTETAIPQGPKTKAVWKGNTLEATVTSVRGVPETITFSRDGEWLVLESRHGEKPMKLYFKKAGTSAGRT